MGGGGGDIPYFGDTKPLFPNLSDVPLAVEVFIYVMTVMWMSCDIYLYRG